MNIRYLLSEQITDFFYVHIIIKVSGLLVSVSIDKSKGRALLDIHDYEQFDGKKMSN